MTENVEDTGQLSTAQRKALAALASGATKDQAAAVADRSRRTIDRWLATDPSFAEAINQTTNAAIEDAGRRLAALLEDAVSAMHYVLKHPDTPSHSRLRAADMITGNMIKLREFKELEERIAALEDRLG